MITLKKIRSMRVVNEINERVTERINFLDYLKKAAIKEEIPYHKVVLKANLAIKEIECLLNRRMSILDKYAILKNYNADTLSNQVETTEDYKIFFNK